MTKPDSMQNDEPRLEFIKVKNLHNFIIAYINKYDKEDDFIIPISPLKALSHMYNPVADKNDVGLILIYQADQCIGYLGLLPDVYRQGQELTKMYWMSPWFIHGDHRGGKIGGLLVQAALNLGKPIASIAENTRAYPKMGFEDLGALRYRRVNLNKLNFISRLIDKVERKARGPKQTKFLNRLKHLTNVTYAPIRRLIARLLIMSLNVNPKKLNLLRTSDIPEDYGMRIQAKDGFHDGKTKINWMLEYPWIIESSEEKLPDYHFSYSRKRFQYIPILLNEEDTNAPLGFAVLMVTAYDQISQVKILDVELPDGKYAMHIFRFALQLAINNNSNHIEYSDQFHDLIKGNLFRNIFVDEMDRHYSIHSNNEDLKLKILTDVQLKYTDGDQIFY